MIRPFLEIVAEDILKKHGTNLAHTAVVFPNKRAALFMNEHLARMSKGPIWSPAYTTISDLFKENATLQVADDIKLICLLHKSFVKCTGIDETLDHFWGWGQLLLTDFDDLDKNMADANQVFTNVENLHELDDASYLTEEQKETLRRFFANFSEEQSSHLKEVFLKLWSQIGNIYTEFNAMLKNEGLCYEGALYRQVAEHADSIPLSYDKYIFVGFNLLQKSEQRLFAALQKQGKALFYWDVDHYYLKDEQNEAGHYVRQYTGHFPNELPLNDKETYDNFSRKKKITYISATTENSQARYVTQWLHEQDRLNDGKQTVIVMCDERLLPAVIHQIPPQADGTPTKANVTTGYPLSSTPIATEVNDIFAHATTKDIVQLTSDAIEKVKAHAKEIATEDLLDKEASFKMYTLLNRISQLIAEGTLSIDPTTLSRIVRQLTQTTAIPFHGEPIEGIQVMGVLETRGIDFSHVLLLSCNEGNMPKSVNDASFIPYSIRKAHDLTTIDNKVAVYAYYFYRLLQRAEDITILYNSADTDGKMSEMSRFMLQLQIESNHDITTASLSTEQQSAQQAHAEINKTPKMMQRLSKRERFSPSTIGKYLRCPLSFYYYAIVGLKEPDDEEDDITSRDFGNIFHKSTELIYKPFMERGIEVTAQDIDQLLKEKSQSRIERIVDQAFKEEMKERLSQSGLQLINRDIIINYIKRQLRTDRQFTPFRIKGLELQVEGSFAGTNFYGFIDRLDEVTTPEGRRIRVVDYKTGGQAKSVPQDVEDIFNPASVGNTKHAEYYLQAFLYSLIVRRSAEHNKEQLPVSPALLFVRNSKSEGYDPTLCLKPEKALVKVVDIADYADDFEQSLSNLMSEIRDINTPFKPTSDKKRCENCAWKEICAINNS